MKKFTSVLDYLDDPTLEWRFSLVYEKIYEGNLIDFKVTGHGVPISFTVMDRNGKVFEIPWSSIQTIELLDKE